MDTAELQVWVYFAVGENSLTELAACSALLDIEEQARAARYVRAVDRTLFCAAHVLLRLCLSRHAPLGPRQWRFVTGGLGRPEITPGCCANKHRLTFSMSHSADMVCCAINSHVPIGIDCERHELLPDVEDLAHRYFAVEESEYMFSVPVGEGIGQRNALFYTYWTLKEAYLKATGEGLLGNLKACSFSFTDSSTKRLVFDAKNSSFQAPTDWAFVHLQVANMGSIAAALPAPNGARFNVHSISLNGAFVHFEPCAVSGKARFQACSNLARSDFPALWQ